MSEGNDIRGRWNSDRHFDYVADPQPAVDGGDGSVSVSVSVSVRLTAEQKVLVKAMTERTQSDPDGDPLTGAELGEGKKKP